LPDIAHLDVCIRRNLLKKRGSGEKLALCHIRRHGFCCKLEAPCAFLIAGGETQGL